MGWWWRGGAQTMFCLSGASGFGSPKKLSKVPKEKNKYQRPFGKLCYQSLIKSQAFGRMNLQDAKLRGVNNPPNLRIHPAPRATEGFIPSRSSRSQWVHTRQLYARSQIRLLSSPISLSVFVVGPIGHRSSPKLRERENQREQQGLDEEFLVFFARILCWVFSISRGWRGGAFENFLGCLTGRH